MIITEKQKNRDIQNILLVLGSAVICAGLLASIFLYYYGPSGRYLAGNTLLDPNIIEQISYQDQHPETGKRARFTFDKIEFSYFDSQKGEIHIPSVSLETYQRFYAMVAFDKSLEEVTRNIQDLFFKSRPSLLTIRMHTEGSTHLVTKVFQVVQFIQEDYFRVQLHETNEGEWAYFYRPGLYQDVMRLFTHAAN